MRCISKDKPSGLTYISSEHNQQVARELVFPEGRHDGTDCVIHRRHHAYKQEVRHHCSLMADRVLT